jgi:hypothetical protein
VVGGDALRTEGGAGPLGGDIDRPEAAADRGKVSLR